MKKDGHTYWIIGAGRFGTRATERLLKRHPEGHFIVVDQSREALERLGRLSAERVCQEGAGFLAEALEKGPAPDWIIPAVPIHLAFGWMVITMGDETAVEVMPVPAQVEAMVPNPVRGAQGQLFMSYADFVCPDNCSEPFDRCTFTGKPRKGLLYKTLEEIALAGFTSVVVRSRQLAPGVGGFRPEALRKSLEEVQASRGPVLYSTACLCHGVMHALNK